MTPTVRYDHQSDAANIRFSPEAVIESEEVSDGIVLDYDAAGRIAGMEVMEASRHLSSSMLAEAA